MKIFNEFKNLVVYDNTMLHLQETEEAYHKYITKLMELTPNQLATFVNVLKKNELINNQENETEDPFIVELQLEQQRIDSIQAASKIINEKHTINKDELQKLHKLVIKGSQDDRRENYNYRTFPTKVGKVINGEEIISYIPPETSEEIDEDINIILNFLNDDSSAQLIDTIFLKPLIAHALIAILQPFGNGNTRLSRVVQHTKIMDMTNKYYNLNLKYPVLYLSKNYLLTHPVYRGHIGRLAEHQDDKYWNKWFEYNLNMLDEQLYFVNNKLDTYIAKK